MRFHVVSLPHTQTTKDYLICAYTEKVRKFCVMMKSLGHTVYLYAGEFNEAPCDELITCVSEQDRRKIVGDQPYVHAKFDPELKHWIDFNNNAIAGISKRAELQDFICLIAGYCQEQIAKAFPDMMSVEFGIGYSGVFAKYRVFESYAWMHTWYGSQHYLRPENANGAWYDAVIPGYLEIERFPLVSKKDDYYLFVGRMIDRKGYQIACDVCRKLGKRLLLAGEGQAPDYGEFIGPVYSPERESLMGHAKALFVPSIYLEPFGNVAVEAMACGTPVISTDWGAMTETVIEGKTGFRCRTQAEFCHAVEKVKELNPKAIRQHVKNNYSLEVIGLKYERYFNRLQALWRSGWYE